MNINSTKKGKCCKLNIKVPAIKHYLGFTVPSIEVEEDHSNNNGSDDGYHFDVDNPSQLEPSSPSPEAGIQL
ncbi:hypothetical protein G6F43_009081 [Rhizopus delemar]|nr:hypothetical protein G6F43_009081 [Rhizopus delemar]